MKHVDRWSLSAALLMLMLLAFGLWDEHETAAQRANSSPKAPAAKVDLKRQPAPPSLTLQCAFFVGEKWETLAPQPVVVGRALESNVPGGATLFRCRVE